MKHLPFSFLLVIAAQSAAAPVDFVREVRPIFEKHCYDCHAEKRQKGGLRLDVKAAALNGGDNDGPNTIPGKRVNGGVQFRSMRAPDSHEVSGYQAYLDGGILKIASALKDVGHAAQIHHEAGFPDGGVVMCFKFPRLNQGESLQLGFVDRETKGIHAGHLGYGILSQSSVTLIDHKTGIIILENRKRRDDAIARKAKVPADLEALLKSKQAVVPWKADTEWHEVALVTEGDQMRLSLDGKLMAKHRSEGFAHPVKRWFSFLVSNTVWIDDVKIWKVK